MTTDVTGIRLARSARPFHFCRMNRLAKTSSPAAAVVLTALFASGCGAPPGAGDVGTPAQRDALVDTLIEQTARREAFSPVKNETLGFSPLEAMEAERAAVVDAETEEELFYALSRLSAARRDRHLSLGLVPGGLEVTDSAGLEVDGGVEVPARVAPIRILPDFAVGGSAYFVADRATDVNGEDLPAIGGRVVSVHGRPVAEWEREATAYMRHSTVAGLRWKLAELMTEDSALLPPSMRSPVLEVTIEGEGGNVVTHELPWLDAESVVWEGVSEPRYAGFETLMETVTFDLLVDDERQIVILIWTGFRETMIDDVDALMELAEQRGLLDYTMIVDVTRSGGGSRGAYAVQRLQPRPFKTTFGNLRLSDVIEPWVRERQEAFGSTVFTDGETPELIDDGSWLMEWLELDVLPALERGDEYTNDVPFKSAHAPRDSDGVLPPAPVHFRGPFAVISGPDGGSHLDQFIHQVVDNELGPVVGMQPGGYSNTWEWEEVVTLPGSGRPLVRFMWNIGHTITPGGAIAEGNPATIDVEIPLGADNVRDYYATLLDTALEALAEWRRPIV